MQNVAKCFAEAVHNPYFVGGSDASGFDLGCKANFQEVFGTDRRYWLIPKSTRYGESIYHGS